MYVAVTLVAAMLAGFGFVLQQHAAEQVRTSEFLRPGLIARLAHNRRWLAGLGILIVGDLLSAWTLGHLDLSVSEPLLTTSLIFALLLAVPLSGQALRRTEIAGAVLLSAGVAALSVTRSVKAPSESFGSFSHWPAAAGIALIAGILVHLGRNRTGPVRATLTGTAAGLILGIADAFTRRTVQVLDNGHALGLLVHWPGYATVVASLIGLWLMQNAFNAAPLHCSLPAVTAAEPAAGMILGVLVFGDVVHVTPWLVGLQLAGIAAMVGGVILVARAPVFRELHLGHLPQAARERLHHHHPAPEADGDDSSPTQPAVAPTTGPQTTGPQTTGPQTTGPQTTGPQTTGPQTTGPQTTGPQPAVPPAAASSTPSASPPPPAATSPAQPGPRPTVSTRTPNS